MGLVVMLGNRVISMIFFAIVSMELLKLGKKVALFTIYYLSKGSSDLKQNLPQVITIFWALFDDGLFG